MAEADGVGNRETFSNSGFLTVPGLRRVISRRVAPGTRPYRGASNMTICRPSKRGSDSILAMVAVSSLTRFKSL